MQQDGIHHNWGKNTAMFLGGQAIAILLLIPIKRHERITQSGRTGYFTEMK